MKNNPIPYSNQWINEEDIEEVAKVLKTGWITQGPKIEEFEKAIADYCGAKYGLAVSNATAALYLAYRSAGIKEGDEVITTPLTFSATSNALIHCKAKPIFVDIEKDTLNINPDLIEKAITSKTKAIVSVDFAGHSCDYERILEISQNHNLLLIEDAAHALGSEYKDKKIGSLADMTVFSFHPVKVITTGEGGMILTNNEDFYKKLKIFRHHGIMKKPEKGGWYYEIEEPTFNSRITDFQCALGLSQLKRIDSFVKRRREIVARYNQAFGNIEEIIIPKEKDYTKSAYHIYVIQLKTEHLKADRKEIFKALEHQGLGLQVHYMPIHLHPFYRKRFGFKEGDFPAAEDYYQRAISIPLFPKMTDQDVDRVIEVIKKTINLYKNEKS